MDKEELLDQINHTDSALIELIEALEWYCREHDDEEMENLKDILEGAQYETAEILERYHVNG